jgi:hypothetical protein
MDQSGEQTYSDLVNESEQRNLIKRRLEKSISFENPGDRLVWQAFFFLFSLLEHKCTKIS